MEKHMPLPLAKKADLEIANCGTTWKGVCTGGWKRSTRSTELLITKVRARLRLCLGLQILY